MAARITRAATLFRLHFYAKAPYVRRQLPALDYILAEARNQTKVTIPATGAPADGINTPQLGPVGGRIVAEVFLGMMFGDNSSVLSLDPQWTPVTGSGFALKDLVAYALGQGDPLH